MFKTELHCHSDSISACARVNNNDIIEKFTSAGYNSLVLTNHFTTGTMSHHGYTDWDRWVDGFVDAYEKLKEDAKGKLNVLLGMELRFDENCNDYLVFGITEEFLRKYDGLHQMNPESFHKIAQENGCLFIQAHPFRNGMTVVRPNHLDGVEVFNGHMGHDSRNEIADMWADKYSLLKTSGTDFHYADVPTNAGIATEYEITSIPQLIETLKSGSYKVIKHGEF